MKQWNKKLEAFTLSEMIIVLILTSIVVGLAFTILILVQRHMETIQNNLNQTTELNKLEQSLSLDFNRYNQINYDVITDDLLFSSELDSKSYHFLENYIIKGRDTFHIQLKTKTMYFDGIETANNKIDAIKLETTKAFQNQHLFIFKANDATQFMD